MTSDKVHKRYINYIFAFPFVICHQFLFGVPPLRQEFVFTPASYEFLNMTEKQSTRNTMWYINQMLNLKKEI